MWRRWAYIRQFKLNFLRFVRMRETPDEIAKGLALGIFIGMTPTLGFQMAIAIFLAMVLRENKIAAALGVWVTNPVTAPVIYALEYESGRLLLGMDRIGLPQELTFSMLQDLGKGVLIPLCFGSLIFGLLCAALTYALTLRLIPLARTWHIPRWPKPRQKKRRDS